MILELKAADDVHPSHTRQVLTYLRASGLRVGYLLNFGAPLMREGIVRFAN